MANYKSLIVWQKCHKLALKIYDITKKFPQIEQFGLTSQLKRAALSIPTNIVEGYNRKSKKELTYFIDISLGSLAEVEYLIEFSYEVGYINKEDKLMILSLIEECGKLLWSFQKSKKH
jgi:four helix bundle protein